jgi:hypothetical protein
VLATSKVFNILGFSLLSPEDGNRPIKGVKKIGAISKI